MNIFARSERQRANKENARNKAREFIAAYFATVCRQNIWDRESSLLRCGFPVSKIILRTVVSSANAFAAGFVS